MGKSFLYAALLAGLSACTLAQPSSDDGTAAATGRSFQNLRSIPGHFAGGSWNDEVDRWNGTKHQIMQRLQAQIRPGEYRDSQVIELMGSPDKVWSDSAEGHADLIQRTEWQGVAEGEIWAYHWRGEHDQLLFAIHEGRVTASGWLLVGE